MKEEQNVDLLNRMVRDTHPKKQVDDWRDLLISPAKITPLAASLLDRVNRRLKLNLPATYMFFEPATKTEALSLWIDGALDIKALEPIEARAVMIEITTINEEVSDARLP